VQPSSQTVAVDQTATFAVTATGNPAPTYQWLNAATSASIAGATSASYTTPATTPANSGSKFQVVATNSAGSQTSSAAMLTVDSSPGFTSQPANLTVTAGQTATFTVVASGYPAPTYQWLNAATGASVAGATSASYTTPATTPANSGSKFQVVATNSAGSQTSSAAMLTVDSAPGITSQPANLTVTAGQTATFTVAATGTAPLGYQWQQGTTNISGASSASYTIAATSSANTGSSFQVIVTNAAGAVTSNPATLTVDTPPVITAQPASQTVTSGQTATFTVVTTGNPAPTYQWQNATTGASIAGATSATYTTPATASANSGSKFQVVATNTAGSQTSSAATLTVNSGSPQSTVKVLTYHDDTLRTGLNPNETILTKANVNSTTFGQIGRLSVIDLVDAEPLYVPNLTINGAAHNVLFVVTEGDLAYAFDADTPGPALWQTSVIPPNETPSDDRGCSEVEPEIGITSTPVVDLSAGPNGTLFAVAMSKDPSGNYHDRLHALDLTTGGDRITPPEIQATFPGNGTGSSGGMQTFIPGAYEERSALLLSNGVIYTTWTSHCESPNYTSWVISYSESTLQQVSVLNLTANGSKQNGEEGGIWSAGSGPATDASGFIYLLLGNGTFDATLDGNGFPTERDFGNSFMKLAASGGSLTVADYFAMDDPNAEDAESESSDNIDLGSGGVMVLPDLQDSQGHVHHLAVGAGKDSNMYIVNRDNMGKFTSLDTNIYQELDGALLGGIWSAPAYFNNTVYYGPAGNHLVAFPIANAQLDSSPSSSSSGTFGYPGTTPSISANGTANGIVWALENGSATGTLHAYDAGNLATELYNSNQASGGRDQFPTNSADKFVTPMIANGKVYVGTPGAVVVFGLLGP
jgi:hypothetical protein